MSAALIGLARHAKPQPTHDTTAAGFGLSLVRYIMEYRFVYGWLSDTELRLAHSATMIALQNPDLLATTREHIQTIRKDCTLALARMQSAPPAATVAPQATNEPPRGNSPVRPLVASPAPKPAPAFEVNF